MNIPRTVLFLDATGSSNGPAGALMLANMSGEAIRAHSADPTDWDTFADGKPVDVVITLSNGIVGEVCAVFWAGRPVTTHWPLPDDPAAAEEKLLTRIEAFLALPFAELSQVDLQQRLDVIGRL